jgi:hypothetical protein
MKNIKTSVDSDGILTILIDTKTIIGPSKSGKVNLVASTGYPCDVPGAPAGFKLGLNAFVGKQ